MVFAWTSDIGSTGPGLSGVIGSELLEFGSSAGGGTLDFLPLPFFLRDLLCFSSAYNSAL